MCDVSTPKTLHPEAWSGVAVRLDRHRITLTLHPRSFLGTQAAPSGFPADQFMGVHGLKEGTYRVCSA